MSVAKFVLLLTHYVMSVTHYVACSDHRAGVTAQASDGADKASAKTEADSTEQNGLQFVSEQSQDVPAEWQVKKITAQQTGFSYRNRKFRCCQTKAYWPRIIEKYWHELQFETGRLLFCPCANCGKCLDVCKKKSTFAVNNHYAKEKSPLIIP